MSSVVAYVAGNYGAGRRKSVRATVFGFVQNQDALPKTICKPYEDSNSNMRMTTMKLKRIRNIVKDIQRGTGNRVADGASLLGEGRDPADFAHINSATPLQTKTRELQNDPQYQAINQVREKSTSRKRADKETKPV